jgi:hypothetical protein
MALKPLDPAPKIGLANKWELVASAAGRTNQDTRASVHLFNGKPQANRTIDLGNTDAQDGLIANFAAVSQLPEPTLTRAFAEMVVAIEDALRQLDRDDGKPSQSTRLVELAVDAGAELFHTPEGNGYASIDVDGHKETWPLKVKGFRRWLARQFYDTEGKSPSSQAVQDALGVLEGKALFDGQEIAVFTRLADHSGCIYLDLANERWQVIEVDANGWRLIDAAPVKFRRARGMLPLPTPVPGGSLANLKSFCNTGSDDDWRLVVSWLIAALRPTGPFPVLVVHGEQGSAKSSLVRVLRSLVDPNQADLRSTPRDERDLLIASSNGWIIALDNLSHLQPWLSDALCRLATGGGFATRELYSDAEETIFSAQRPIAVNGIEELAHRGDLLDRAIALYLPSISEDKRRDQAAFWNDFEVASPAILGALLDAVSVAIRNLPSVKLDRLPRMADFAKWACAATHACGWGPDEFLAAYTRSREATYDLVLEASPIASLIRDLVATKAWEGTASELLADLENLAAGSGKLSAGTAKVGRDVTKQKTWPKNGRSMSNALRRIAPTLRVTGISVEFLGNTGTNRSRKIRLCEQLPPSPTGTSPKARVSGKI